MRKLFVYDVSSYSEVVQILLGKPKVLVKAILRNHNLCLDGQDQLYVVEDLNHEVQGYVIEVDQEEMWKLDCWRSMPDYTRTDKEVFIEDQQHKVFVFTKVGIYNHRKAELLIHNLTELERVQSFSSQYGEKVYPALDLYIMIPCVLERSEISVSAIVDHSGITANYLKTISTIAHYEMDDELASQLTRCLLCQVEVICLTDDIENKSELGRQKINIYLTQHKETGLACVTLFFPNMKLPVTHILDQMSRNEIIIAEEEKQVYLLDWLHKKFGLKRMGMSRSFTNLSKEIDKLDLMYLLANEVNGSKMIEYKLMGEDFRNAAKLNLAQFDMSEIYVHETSVVQILKDYKDRFEERLYNQALTLFIMELVLMQDVAVARVSHKVSLELKRQSNISLKVIEEINFEFAKTMFLWNLNQFKYSATQTMVNSIIKGFKLKDQLEAYKINKEFLVHLINVHSARNTDRKTLLLNICVIFLTLSQVLPIYYDISRKVLFGKIEAFDIRFGIISTVAVAIIFIISRMFLIPRKS
jgi:gamma-glutamylcyclotransferase (GGCT)/AIG2-like uncharacterized protein YtfP